MARSKKVNTKRFRLIGGIDITVIFVIIAILFAVLLSSGSVPKPSTTPIDGKYIPETPSAGSNLESLQLKYFTFKKVDLPKGNACVGDRSINVEPDIIYASDPAFGGIAQASGQVRIWVWEDDGNGGSVAPGEKVDETGKIITPGDRTLADDNGYLWEPALYITPLTTPDQPGPYMGDKENGGQAYFPSYIKGVANYGPQKGDLFSAPIDPPVNIIVKKTGTDWTFSEFIWDVSTLGLTTGYYRAQIILHDGDTDLAINCTTIQI